MDNLKLPRATRDAMRDELGLVSPNFPGNLDLSDIKAVWQVKKNINNKIYRGYDEAAFTLGELYEFSPGVPAENGVLQYVNEEYEIVMLWYDIYITAIGRAALTAGGPNCLNIAVYLTDLLGNIFGPVAWIKHAIGASAGNPYQSYYNSLGAGTQHTGGDNFFQESSMQHVTTYDNTGALSGCKLKKVYPRFQAESLHGGEIALPANSLVSSGCVIRWESNLKIEYSPETPA